MVWMCRVQLMQGDFDQQLCERRQRYRDVALLLQQWMSEDSAYDEMVGVALDDNMTELGTRLEETT